MLFTAESVTPRHPDKMCDQISDLILDITLTSDPEARVAIETMGGHKEITITGELTTKAKFNQTSYIGYICDLFPELADYNFHFNISKQSPDIAHGVDKGGAGDQGIMIGYACNDNEEFLPQEYFLARMLAQRLYKQFPYDGKTQVTIDEKGVVKAVVASFQNVKRKHLEKAVKNIIKSEKYFINPAGDWNIGGMDADTGLTGRKLAVDSYGTRIPLGGGAFSGKDSTKVDRSGAYMARRIAVDYLEKYNAKFVGVKLAYAIGVVQPVMAVASIVDREGKVQDVKIEGYDLSPKGIIKFLDLRKPVFVQTAQWGHFGRDFNWK